MRSQRFIYTLPSQDDSLVIPDSDTASIFSSPYSCPETVWSQVISPEIEGLVPFCIYQYPLLQISPSQPEFPGQFTSPMTNDYINTLENASHYTNEFPEIYDVVSGAPSYDTSYEGSLFTESFLYDNSFCCENIETIIPEAQSTCPVVSTYGTATILLRHFVRVDVSPGKAIYVTNPPATCIASINGMGDRSCVIHPNGRVFHDGREIHMTTLNRRAKISKRGIVFTSTDHCLSYLVDAAGTKTTNERFRNLSDDFSLDIFYDNAMAHNNVEECYNMVSESRYKIYRNGDEVWFVGGFRIKQDQKGDVKVSRCNGRQVIRTSPTTGQVSIKTFSGEYSIGRYPNKYFFVRKGSMQVRASLREFNVQYGTQKAGFNSSGKVVIY